MMPKARILCAIDGKEVVTPPIRTCESKEDSEYEGSNVSSEPESAKKEHIRVHHQHLHHRPPPILHPLTNFSCPDSSPRPHHPPSIRANQPPNLPLAPTQSTPIKPLIELNVFSQILLPSENLRDIVSEPSASSSPQPILSSKCRFCCTFYRAGKRNS
ncbi:hypothetical protein SISSUDRAFT_585105 [Sistotremastrum suecicum HHB10207 ss-3]|uniref:Uncharacterized protein n=1 Tax=Sistotremastrum suecicum HHB10207 ss-3 TaxID=1314776 RepID=A0A165XDR8_9AGAM|nr:hypothetical protein SISSUDRAFT_585105 [Sistotremastrum suecicum HHB10207 ss-3]